MMPYNIGDLDQHRLKKNDMLADSIKPEATVIVKRTFRNLF